MIKHTQNDATQRNEAASVRCDFRRQQQGENDDDGEGKTGRGGGGEVVCGGVKYK